MLSSQSQIVNVARNKEGKKYEERLEDLAVVLSYAGEHW